MYPRGNFANRYVTLPLIKTRLLHWINYKYDSPGYLHWGFNAWGANGDPFGDVSAPANDWPGGDSVTVSSTRRFGWQPCVTASVTTTC